MGVFLLKVVHGEVLAGDGVMLRKRFGLVPAPGVGQTGRRGPSGHTGKLFLIFSIQNNPGVGWVGFYPLLIKLLQEKSQTLRNSSFPTSL